MPDFQIDPDISRAQTPPARFYTDPAILEAMKRTAFARSWQWIADADVVKTPGSVYPCNFLEGAIDEPILFTRDHQDRIHCLANVCTHRGNLLCLGAGVETSLRCRYHGRRFDLDGKFRHMPEFEGVAGFPSEADDLPRIPWALWGRFLFASLNPASALEEMLRPMIDRIGWMPLHEFQPDPTRQRDYVFRANWALYIDNYLEGFHIPYIHAALNQQLDYENYLVELLPHGVLQVGTAEADAEAFDLPPSSPDAGRRIAAYYYWFFPNLMFNFYPWGLSINVVRPLAVDRTRVTFLPYVWKPDRIDRGAGAALDRVEREDEAVVEATHRGLQSGFYRRGRYSVKRENGVHHFHRLAVQCLR
ncbi:MAG: aromatic ring-hydroxylating dioxygenase subunit alpha [Phycisphaerae bacterium]|nr:aromatic ring-hydroxylating dioxygenase subunit alpha [Phycisphaerae bacterium]MDW8262973.1 aromatic ring-hydroxylating dioxygenase subunit alpha [Phycisphaerales bacterium]